MTNISIADLRREYARQELTEDAVAAHPMDQFAKWFAEAVDSRLTDPNAMTLATADSAGRPSARILLLKGFTQEGLTFYSNYLSRKARELEENPHAAMVFWWAELERQVSICGTVSRVAEKESDAYFSSRPRDSRIGAWASEQSAVIASRNVLTKRFAELENRYEGADIPRPAHWGGYILRPVEVEFWQGRPSRLHDRIRYRKSEDEPWLVERLSP